MMNPSIALSKNTLISLGTVILIGALIVGFLVNNESRLTTIEASHIRFQKLEEDVEVNKMLLIEMKGLNKNFGKLDQRVERMEAYIMK